MRISKEILARAVEAYRKIRNTLRYLLANLYDFDPAARRRGSRRGSKRSIATSSPATPMSPHRVLARVRGVRLRNDLSGAERVRDRRPERVLRRRLEGSALHVRRRIARAALGADRDVRHGRRPDAPAGADPVLHGRRALAALPGTREASVHIALFPNRADLDALARQGPAGERWDRLRAIREQVLAEIEPLRKDKQIGSSLQAKVVLSPAAGDLAFLDALRGAPADALHRVRRRDCGRRPGRSRRRRGRPRCRSRIERAGGVKCERCWRYVPAVSSEPAWAGLCERCQHALATEHV